MKSVFSRICSRHFEDSDFAKSPGGKMFLMKGVMPLFYSQPEAVPQMETMSHSKLNRVHLHALSSKRLPMPATLQHVGKSKSKQFVYEQQRALPDNKKPDTINRRKRQKRMKEKLSTKEVCPKKVIDCNAVILKKRPLKSIEKDPNLQKDIPDISDDISKSLTSKSQIESEYFKILIKETGLVIQRLSEKLDEVEANTYKGLVDARVEENGYKKSEFENENPMQKINADFTKMDEIIRHLQTHVICNSQRTVQDIPFVAEINYLRNANYELKKDVNDLKLRLYKLQLQRLRQQEYDSDENGRTDLISQQRKTPALVYITD